MKHQKRNRKNAMKWLSWVIAQKFWKEDWLINFKSQKCFQEKLSSIKLRKMSFHSFVFYAVSNGVWTGKMRFFQFFIWLHKGFSLRSKQVEMIELVNCPEFLARRFLSQAYCKEFFESVRKEARKNVLKWLSLPRNSERRLTRSISKPYQF